MTTSFDSTAHEAANPKDATSYTRDHNASVAASLAFRSDDHELATRGLIATHPTGVIDGPFGPAWDCGAYDFIRQRPDAPDTVNPSLWRQARLNSEHGLFEVDEGLWQVRGYDLSVISFIAGDTGWLIIDPLTSAETAAAALAMANEHLGPRPVKAIIYTHSHVDHYGGVLGVTTREAVAAGEVQVIAPEGFLHEVVSENLIGGTAMMRRGHYQFGPFLTPGEKG
ncbi:MAG: MBL fold metallo-hydrolase, partial [Acidimicrobiales bacterium]|nr:MBL fold metallo-hydrolase [Acidimicrobiales bacterium]